MANLRDINTLPELESLSGAEKVLANINGEAKQISTELIKDMIKEVACDSRFLEADGDPIPELDELTGEEKILVNVNGEARQVPTKLVGKIETNRELVNEWNFAFEDEVYEVNMNVDNDLSWLIEKSGKYGFEFVVEYYSRDNTDETYVEIFTSYPYHAYRKWNGVYCRFILLHGDNSFCALTINGHFDDDGLLVYVDIGGNIHCESPNPYKSIKLYKITY